MEKCTQKCYKHDDQWVQLTSYIDKQCLDALVKWPCCNDLVKAFETALDKFGNGLNEARLVKAYVCYFSFFHQMIALE